MKVSVIIPSYNGANHILQTLHSVANQTRKPHEVIVMVDGSKDETESLVSTHYPNVRVYYQENKGRSGAKNSGANLAEGDLLLFVDDDVELEKGVIDLHWKHHARFEESLCVGRVKLNSSDASDFMTYRSVVEESWYADLPEYPKPMAQDHLFVTAANLSIPRTLFDELNGFEEALTDGEDSDLGYRALKMGKHVFFQYNAVVWHEDVRTCKQYIERRREYERAKIVTTAPSFIKRGVYRLFATSLAVRLIDSERVLWLPRSFRFQVYSVVVWALSRYFPNKKI